MDQGHRRHDISDRVWGLLEPLPPGRPGAWGGKAQDNRLFMSVRRQCELLTPCLPFAFLRIGEPDGSLLRLMFCYTITGG